MYDESFERMRNETFIYMKNKEESAVKKWLDEIGYTEPVAYYLSTWKKEMEIYATRVGILIGRAGANVEILKKILTEEFGGEYIIKFIEIRGGFVNI